MQLAEPSSLTPRQREVRELMRHGYSNKEISRRLHITERTVKAHVAEVCIAYDVLRGIYSPRARIAALAHEVVQLDYSEIVYA